MNLKSHFPNASASFFDLNGGLQGTEPKSTLCHEPLDKGKRKKANPGRCLIRYTSYRCKLLDPDNICFKYFTDALRYEGIIRDDTIEDVVIETKQKKVDHKSQEKTLIELLTI